MQMDRNEIDLYDLVEVIDIPEKYLGVIDPGDVGVVVEKYNDHNFQVECIQPGGSYKWLEKLDRRYLRLKSRDPFSRWSQESLPSITKPSIRLGARIGALFGALMGAGLGAITQNLNGILIGLSLGLLLGLVTGSITGALTVRIAGTSGGVGVGYFTGMIFGGVAGLVIGLLIPTPWRLNAQTHGLPLLDALMMGRFETAVLLSFLLSILDTIVGVWIGGKNQLPRNLKERYRS